MATTTKIEIKRDYTSGFVWDSGSVASGAVINSDVFDLTQITALQLIVDNTAASVFRDLTMTTYLDDGTTQIDSVVLRKCAFGTAPTGSSYAPGAIRGQVGSGLCAPTNGVHLLYDATSAANSAIDTGRIVTEGMLAVSAMAIAAGGSPSCSASLLEMDDGGTGRLRAGITLTGTVGRIRIAPGVALSSGGSANADMQDPVSVPRSIQITIAAAGSGVTERVIVNGYGPTPGTFTHPCILPTRAKFTLGAAGSAAARLTVIGR